MSFPNQKSKYIVGEYIRAFPAANFIFFPGWKSQILYFMREEMKLVLLRKLLSTFLCRLWKIHGEVTGQRAAEKSWMKRVQSICTSILLKFWVEFIQIIMKNQIAGHKKWFCKSLIICSPYRTWGPQNLLRVNTSCTAACSSSLKFGLWQCLWQIMRCMSIPGMNLCFFFRTLFKLLQGGSNLRAPVAPCKMYQVQ